MHAGGVTRPSQTAGSQVSILYERVAIHWFTATSTPCISLYKPVFIEAGLPGLGSKPRGTYNPETLWWRHEVLHRRMMCNYRKYAPELRERIESLEKRFLEKAYEARIGFLEGSADKRDLKALTEEAFKEAAVLEEEFIRRVKPQPCLNPLYMLYWWRMNRQAGIK